MITRVNISNFRSVEKQAVNLAPLTFLYGNNAAGKSSLFYSLNILRNIVSDPNQALDNFFNLGFANLGTFKQIVYKHEDTKSIIISISGRYKNVDFTYGVRLHPKQSEFTVELQKPYSIKLVLPVSFPYPLNGSIDESLTVANVAYKVNWNGIVAQVTPATPTEETNQQAKMIAYLLNRGTQLIRSLDLVPLKRGFSKPLYGVINITQYPVSEEEVASLLAVEDYLDSKVSTYLEQIIDRQFRAKPQSGTSQTSLTTIERSSKTTTDLVNDGFGVNQLVYFLAKTLNKNIGTLCVEEPEINLHPNVVRRVPHTLIELIRDEKKQLIISTHSEGLILALLSAIAEGEIAPADVAFYLTSKEGSVTSFARQDITENGQITDGLSSFMGNELEDIEKFFKAKKAKRGKKKGGKEEPTIEQVLNQEVIPETAKTEAVQPKTEIKSSEEAQNG